jgi:hypothetical protein
LKLALSLQSRDLSLLLRCLLGRQGSPQTELNPVAWECRSTFWNSGKVASLRDFRFCLNDSPKLLILLQIPAYPFFLACAVHLDALVLTPASFSAEQIVASSLQLFSPVAFFFSRSFPIALTICGSIPALRARLLAAFLAKYRHTYT